MHKGVVLLFGTFNPFTNAHLQIGRLAKEKYPDFDIYYVPAKAQFMSSYKKLSKEDILPEEERLDLIKGSVKNIPDFHVTDIEYSGTVSGKTIDTVDYFKNKLGYTDAVLCFGTDKVPELEDWYRGKELVKDNRFLIITRDGITLSEVMTPYTNTYRDNFTEVSNRIFDDISGTGVRTALAEGNLEYVKKAVPEYVYDMVTKELRR